MKLFNTINWPLLRDQKQTLLMLRDSARTTVEESTHIDGIINLLDTLQDEAVESCEASEILVFGERTT